MTRLPMLWTARLALAGVALLAGTSAQAASVQFASFNQLPGDTSQQFNFTNNGSTTSPGATFSYTGGNVSFSFTGVSGVPNGPYTASVSFTGSANAAAQQTIIPGFGTIDTQAIQAAMLTFTDVASGKILLQAQFTGTMSARDGDTAISITTSAVTYGSNFLNFTNVLTRALTFQFNPTNSPIGIASNGLLSSFSGQGSGQFSSDPPPVAATGVPEPSSVAMLALGLAGVPVLRRIRRRKVTVA